MNHVLYIESAQQRTPVHFCRGWIKQKTAGRALQKSLQTGEGRLPKLAERNRLVRLEGLQPYAEAELMTASVEKHAVFERIEVTGDGEITSIIAAGQPQLRLRIRRRTSAHDHRPYRGSGKESWDASCRGSR